MDCHSLHWTNIGLTREMINSIYNILWLGRLEWDYAHQMYETVVLACFDECRRSDGAVVAAGRQGFSEHLQQVAAADISSG